MLSQIVKKNIKKIKANNKELVTRQIIREIINTMVKDVILNTNTQIKKFKIKSIKDVYNSKKTIVCFSKKISSFDLAIKKFLRTKMYYSKEVLKKTNKGKFIIQTLFKEINKNPKKYLNVKINKKDKKERIICDFIAGMTDRYAINLYNKIK